jgi:nucleoside-diphosphate-sugar epimerase
MAALVTGAFGFVGSHVVDELLVRGMGVRALIRNPGQAQELRHRGVEVLVGDMLDPGTLSEAVRGATTVYHCAAAVGPAYTPRQLHDINLLGVANVLQAMRDAGAGRLVLLTSVNVLGTRHLDPATEDMACRRSRDAAADVKIEIEELAREHEQRHGLDVTILRLGMVYGPRDPLNLPQMARALRRGKFTFIGSRDHIIPIVFVRDAVEAILLAGASPAARGRVYHITDGSRVTIGQFVDHLATQLGCPRPEKVLPYAVPYFGCLLFETLAGLRLYRGRPPIARNSLRLLGTSRYFDITRAQQELGYAPRVLYTEGLAAAVPSLQEPSDVSDVVSTAAAGNTADTR